MADRPRFFDDVAGVAGGALSALTGVREEAEAVIRSRVDEMIRKLDLVRRSDLDPVQEMAANARTGQEAAAALLTEMEARIARLEARVASLETAAAPPASGAARPFTAGPGAAEPLGGDSGA
ncbi:MAG: accessory factor UbiK family protein [Acetobacteraceae bacterium]|nr:accessory factor UbiK family protein [Acetobacteraceae bacterium]